ncbi:MAG TPA: hypothetical protein VFS33_10900 [Gemmatimonadales bacterium]|nr:hypothetical protein [Gemmatimonadales bacterium]
MRTPRLSDERGIALALAVFALVVVGALVAGIFYTGQLEQRSGRNTLYASQAQEAAEAGLAYEVGNWNSTVYNALPNGATLTDQVRMAVGPTGSQAATTFTTSVTRLNGTLFLIRSTGERFRAGGNVDQNVMGSRSVGMFARLMTASFTANAALTSRGNVRVGGNVTIDGNDNIPTGWGGCTTTAAKPGIRTSGTVTTNGQPSISGDPDKQTRDASVTDASIRGPYDAIKGSANKIYTGNQSLNGMAPVLTTPISPDTVHKCKTDVMSNWGEPIGGPGTYSVCQSYAPIIWVKGSLDVQTGRGQGILLVDGDLNVRGNFEFAGIVIVLGSLNSNGTGNKISGTVMAANADIGDLTDLGGNPQVRFSSCAINRVLQLSASAKPTARSFVQLYN